MTKRYLLTSAQSNTLVVSSVWENVLALAAAYKAEVLVGTYTYNKAGIGAKDSKRKTSRELVDTKEWWDARVLPYICDERRELAPDLVWCGEMQILPTAQRPLSGMDNYTATKSSIFPHAKIAMSSVPSIAPPTKMMYTTGAVTAPNYIQKKAGLKAEFHHALACLIVEVQDDGRWWVRQINAEDDTGTMQDLWWVARGGKVEVNGRIEAIVWGDLHHAKIDPVVEKVCWGEDGMLRQLCPAYQIFHDLFDGQATEKHVRGKKQYHEMFRNHTKGVRDVGKEVSNLSYWLRRTAHRDHTMSVVVNSNHDAMLEQWLESASHKTDPKNALFYLKLAYHHYLQMSTGKEEVGLLDWALCNSRQWRDTTPKPLFLKEDESFLLVPDAAGGIECGMHGHLGFNGARGTIQTLARTGRKSIIGHSHSAGIFEGCYQVGLSGLLKQGYNRGPSSWSHTHCIVYHNGKRTLVTLKGDQWKAHR